jgi:dTDP-4-amino-4,6-dideoxygalactose transaminase
MPIYVTKPLLPPVEEFFPYLEKIWANEWLTNDGPFHKEFEESLAQFLKVDHLSLFANGTLGLVTALQALRVTGEVITTPYSFVATAHSLLWNGVKPIFVDIGPDGFNIDPDAIEAAITPQTTAILAVHTYGNPCDTERIQRIADRYGLKVIYDAAHAFAIEDSGGSILRHGDLSVLSFHATKVFNTFEGGAIICPDAKIKRRLDDLKNFGFADEVTVTAPGINAKMNEVQAAFGLLQLKHVGNAIRRRGEIDRRYRDRLIQIPGLHIPETPSAVAYNYSYFPLLVGEDALLNRDALYEALKSGGINTRRYFYPLISEFPMYRGLASSHPSNLPNAHRRSRQILCLPIYPSLSNAEQDQVIGLIHRHLT